MDRDDITDAFSRWKMAQDAFLATEQRFFATVGKSAHQFPAKRVHEADPLFIEVQAKRAHAEGLLLVAMKLLHERRHPGAVLHDPQRPVACPPVQAGAMTRKIAEPMIAAARRNQYL